MQAGNGTSSYPFFLLSFGFTHCEVDHSLYIKVYAYSFTNLLVYIDDDVLARNFITEINNVKEALDAKFKIKYSGQLRYFLEFKIVRTNSRLFLNQRQYTFDLLQKNKIH